MSNLDAAVRNLQTIQKRKAGLIESIPSKCFFLFFPAYLLGFVLLEQFDINATYHLMHLRIDELIPFNEWFVIPYLAWHVLIAAMSLYLYKHDESNFRRLICYFAICTIVSFAIYAIYPTYQDLRPACVPDNNFLCWVVSLIYSFDTNTNVCPSMHVSAALGLLFASFHTNKSFLWRITWLVVCLLICVSTLFIKQHSVIDVSVALVLSFIAWLICYADETYFFKKRYTHNS